MIKHYTNLQLLLTYYYYMIICSITQSHNALAEFWFFGVCCFIHKTLLVK